MIVPPMAAAKSHLSQNSDLVKEVVPDDINQLLVQYSHLFVEPVGLPLKEQLIIKFL